MDCLVSHQELRILGGLAVLFILAAVWVEQTAIERTDLPGFKRAGMAVQRSGTKEIVRSAVGEKNSPHREQLKKGLRRDFVLILTYAGLFAALGLLLSQAHVSGARWWGIAAAISILGAAAFDVIENYKTFEILSLDSASITDSLSRTVRLMSTLKWLLFYLPVRLEGLILIELMNWFSLIGGLMLISAIAGVIGVRSHQLLTPAAVGLGVAVIILGLILLAAPQKILRLVC